MTVEISFYDRSLVKRHVFTVAGDGSTITTIPIDKLGPVVGFSVKVLEPPQDDTAKRVVSLERRLQRLVDGLSDAVDSWGAILSNH